MHIGLLFRKNSFHKVKAYEYFKRALAININNFGIEHYLTKKIKNFSSEVVEKEEEEH